MNALPSPTISMRWDAPCVAALGINEQTLEPKDWWDGGGHPARESSVHSPPHGTLMLCRVTPGAAWECNRVCIGETTPPSCKDGATIVFPGPKAVPFEHAGPDVLGRWEVTMEPSGATEVLEPRKYVTVADSTWVSSCIGLGGDGGSRKVASLPKGTRVEVIEVRRCEDMKRVRGRITDPAGWISLEDLSDGYRWVDTGIKIKANGVEMNKAGLYEAKAETGKWWPVKLTWRNGDKFRAEVADGHGTVWDVCLVTNIRLAAADTVPPAAGASVTVREALTSGDAAGVPLKVGQKGVVKRIDGDGDAVIDFSHHPKLLWVLKSKFRHLHYAGAGEEKRRTGTVIAKDARAVTVRWHHGGETRELAEWWDGGGRPTRKQLHTEVVAFDRALSVVELVVSYKVEDIPGAP